MAERKAADMGNFDGLGVVEGAAPRGARIDSSVAPVTFGSVDTVHFGGRFHATDTGDVGVPSIPNSGGSNGKTRK